MMYPNIVFVLTKAFLALLILIAIIIAITLIILILKFIWNLAGALYLRFILWILLRDK